MLRPNIFKMCYPNHLMLLYISYKGIHFIKLIVLLTHQSNVYYEQFQKQISESSDEIVVFGTTILHMVQFQLFLLFSTPHLAAVSIKCLLMKKNQSKIFFVLNYIT